MKKNSLRILVLIGLGIVLSAPMAQSASPAKSKGAIKEEKLPQCSDMQRNCTHIIKCCLAQQDLTCKTDGHCGWSNPISCGGISFRDNVCLSFGSTKDGKKGPAACQDIWKENKAGETPEELCTRAAHASKGFKECDGNVLEASNITTQRSCSDVEQYYIH
jgi:hypothetical protein